MARPYAAIVGLGNPGLQYRMTRHNAGFMVLDAWALDLGLTFYADKDTLSEYTRLPGGERLIKPQTYMNDSGQSVSAWVRRFKWELEEVLIVVDDVQLELGQLRFRRRGSHGGQNGLRSIEQHLGTQAYPRLRLGVGKQPAGWSLSSWVLSRFPAAEEEPLLKMIKRAREAIECCQTEGIQVAMNRYNGESAS
jgi:PTH1 family peptidyl-tRNA hydrolase